MIGRRHRTGPWSAVALAVAVVAALALLAGPVGTGAGAWHFSTGFTLLRWAFWLGAGAVLLALAALVRALLARHGTGVALAALGLAISLTACLVPLVQYRKARMLPPINDITTNPEAAPEFLVAGRGAENGAAGVPYPGEEFARQQRGGYPDLRPIRLPQSPAAVFDAALAVAREAPGWAVVRADRDAGAIEAVVTTRWFRFEDDVAIRVLPAGAAAMVDVRSRSRVGRSDVGANAERIRAFRERLLERLRETRAP